MSHKHHNNNPFKNPENLDENITDENQNNSENCQENTENNITDEALNELQQKYDTLNQQYLRLAADFDNYRKRQEQEREELLKFGTENALKKMIEVLDNFERGEKALENVEDCVNVKESFELVHKQVIDALTKLGLEVIDTQGKEFDPNLHQAVMTTQDDQYDHNIVVEELQKGYKLKDRVIRASLVKVNE